MNAIKSVFIVLSIVAMVSSLNAGSLTENRKSNSTSSDIASELPLAMFYDYNYLIPYTNNQKAGWNNVLNAHNNRARKFEKFAFDVYQARVGTNYTNPLFPAHLKTISSRDLVAQMREMIEFSVRDIINKVSSEETTYRVGIVGSPRWADNKIENGYVNMNDRMADTWKSSATIMIEGKSNGRGTYNDGQMALSGTNSNNVNFSWSSDDGAIVSKRDGKPWIVFGSGEYDFMPLFGGLVMIKTNGANFILYKGYWKDDPEKEPKYEKEVKYACGLIEKAKTLKGKKVSEAEARDFFKTVTPCAVAPKINAGTVIFDLQSNIVLGQRVVLNERASKEKSDSNSQQRLNY